MSVGPEQRTAKPQLHDHRLVQADGLVQPVTRWRADDPTAVVLFLHSFGDYREAAALTGPWLAERGITVYAYDQRGFGETARRGYWPGADALIQDMRAVVELLRQRYPTRPLYVIGESMGASVALAADARGHLHGVEGLIAVGPGVRENIRFRRGWDALLWAGSRIAPGFNYPINRNDDGSLHPTAAERLGDDPGVFQRVRIDTYAGLVRLTDEASDRANSLSRPSLILYGADDGMVPETSVCALYRRHPGPRQLLIQQGGSHLLLQARDYRQSLRYVVDWINNGRVAPSTLAKGWRDAGCPGNADLFPIAVRPSGRSHE